MGGGETPVQDPDKLTLIPIAADWGFALLRRRWAKTISNDEDRGAGPSRAAAALLHSDLELLEDLAVPVANDESV